MIYLIKANNREIIEIYVNKLVNRSNKMTDCSLFISCSVVFKNKTVENGKNGLGSFGGVQPPCPPGLTALLYRILVARNNVLNMFFWVWLRFSGFVRTSETTLYRAPY